MISRLINLDISTLPIEKEKKKGIYTISDYARAFISGMEKSQLDRFKQMLNNNIECGRSVATNYGVDYNSFIKEVKNQLNVN